MTTAYSLTIIARHGVGAPRRRCAPLPDEDTVCTWAQLWAGVSRSPWELLEELDTC